MDGGGYGAVCDRRQELSMLQCGSVWFIQHTVSNAETLGLCGMGFVVANRVGASAIGRKPPPLASEQSPPLLSGARFGDS
jgi:hypothetical protein